MVNNNRLLIHTGKFLRQPDTGFKWYGWTELVVLLFDDYRTGFGVLDVSLSPTHELPLIVVMTKPKEKDGITKYQVCKQVSHVQCHTASRIFSPSV